MKKYLTILIAMLTLAPVYANNATADDEKDWEVSHPFKSSDEGGKHWKVTSSGIYLGAGVSHSWDVINNSFEAGMLNIISLEYNTLHGQTFSLGAGIHHRSYSMKRPNMLICDNETHITGTIPYPTEYSDKNRSSNLNMWAVQFPLLFKQRIYKKLGIKIGGIMNWNFKALASNHYETANADYDITYKGLKQNKVTFDAIGGLTIDSFGVYCRYSPAKFFEKGYGPEIKDTWTLGVAFGF